MTTKKAKCLHKYADDSRVYLGLDGNATTGAVLAVLASIGVPDGAVGEIETNEVDAAVTLLPGDKLVQANSVYTKLT